MSFSVALASPQITGTLRSPHGGGEMRLHGVEITGGLAEGKAGLNNVDLEPGQLVAIASFSSQIEGWRQGCSPSSQGGLSEDQNPARDRCH